jgi:ABC-2 type transport system ATP-binding protein
MSIVDISQARKTYGNVVAVDGISLRIEQPGIVALLGANGAGKTTTIDMLMGLRKPSGGTVRVFGRNPMEPDARVRVGSVPQEGGVPSTLRVNEIVDFVAAQYPQALPAAQMLDDLGLAPLAKRQAAALSGGELRRLTLALAFVGRPQLVVLDEPTNGLDVAARRNVWNYIRGYARSGGTVLLTTHHMEEAEALSSRIVVMDRGRIVRDGSAAEIRGRVASRRLVYELPHGETISVDAADTDEAIRELVRNNVPFKNLCIVDGSLEDAVLALIEEPVA